jgi:DNA end-binding protein Ku
MPSRPSWDGFLKFNLISVPVKAYNAIGTSGGKVGFHLLHKKCHSRIRYKKVCPIHGEVSNDEIVSGYEVAKGQYAIVDREERAELKIEDDKAIALTAFVAPEAVDPVYYSGRSYYLVPDGKVAQKPYVVMHDAMRDQNRYAVAQVVFAGKGVIAVVRPFGKLLAMSLLTYESEIKKPAAFESEVESQVASAQERKLAETLVAAATADDFDLAQYKDEYAAKLASLVGKKAKPAKRAIQQGAEEQPDVINLMDALRRSLHSAQKEKAGKGVGKSAARSRKPARAHGKKNAG